MYDQSRNQLQVTGESSYHDTLEDSVAIDAPRHSTVSYREPDQLIGHDDVQLRLSEWLSSNSPILCLYGNCGSGSVCRTQNLSLLLSRLQENLGGV